MKSSSDISLSTMNLGPVKGLLKVDLALIAAMQESLKDTKYAKHVEYKSQQFDAKRMIKELGEQKAQIKYWTSKLEEQDQTMTGETTSAIALNLARVAQAFGMLWRVPCMVHLLNKMISTRN